MRKSIAENRAASVMVHSECSLRHQKVVEAAGEKVDDRTKNRRDRIDQMLKQLKALNEAEAKNDNNEGAPR